MADRSVSMNMARLILYVAALCVSWAVGMLLSPFLPLLAVMRDGPSDNGNASELAPRLPLWLSWFDTSYDNSLWGDQGWRSKHAPAAWGTYWGMSRWLRRNCACGFAWSVLAWPARRLSELTVASSGCGLNLDKSHSRNGWFFIKSGDGAFQLRWVKTFGKLQISLDAGWMLDVYVKDPATFDRHPRAVFMCAPLLRVVSF